MNPAVLVIDDEVFRQQLPASRSAEEMAVHLLGRQGGAPWLGNNGLNSFRFVHVQERSKIFVETAAAFQSRRNKKCANSDLCKRTYVRPTYVQKTYVRMEVLSRSALLY